jgi:hypothetical protein
MTDLVKQHEAYEIYAESDILTLLPWLREVQQFAHECRVCRQELPAHWQLCTHCDIRQATHCLSCDNPLPPAGASACPSCGLALPLLVA